jgi:acyl-CoA synthetase (NDP forming)
MAMIGSPSTSLERLFNPRGVAFAGASENPAGYGGRIVRYFLDARYDGKIGFVNPKYGRVFGLPCHRTLDDVPGEIDVVVAMVGPARLPDLYASAARRGVGYLVVIGELAEGEEVAKAQQLDALREQLRAGGPRIVGPVCVGVVSPPARLCMSISSALPAGMPRAGGIGLVSQSGGIIGAVIDRSRLSGAGFSRIVSSGGEFDLGLCDYLEYMLDDAATRVMAVYGEGIDDYDRFLALADRARQAGKPIILLKAGRSEAGAKAALSHSGRIVGDQMLEEAVMRRHGVLLAEDIDDLHVTASLLARNRLGSRGGIGAASLSGGFSVVVGDALSRAGLPVAELAPETCDRLRAEAAQAMPTNPVDAGSRPTPGREALDIRAALEALDDDPGVGATLYAETTFLNPETVVDQLAGFASAARKPHLTCWQAGPAMADAVARLRARDVLVVESLAQALAALRAPTPGAARESEWLRAEQSGPMANDAARRLLAAYRIPLVDERFVAVNGDPGEAARALGLPAVLKGVVPGTAHKTELGLVRVGLASVDEVNRAAREMQRAHQELTGFYIQPLLSGGMEMLVGVKSDPTIGAVVLLGFGGIFAEAMAPPIAEAAPFPRTVAEELIDKVDRKGILRGYRTGHRYVRSELAELLVAVSELAFCERGRIAEIDLNPVIVTTEKVAAVDWLVVLRRAETRVQSRSRQ